MDNQNPVQEPPIVNAPQAQPITQPPQQAPTGNTPPVSGEIQKTVPTILVVLLLLFAYPIGLLFMWLGTKWPKRVKTLITLPIPLAILGLILALSIAKTDPLNKFSNAETAMKKSLVNQTLNAIEAYAKDNNSLPSAISALPENVPASISKTGADICSDLIPKYIYSLPRQDPDTGSSSMINETDCNGPYDTGYSVKHDASGRVTVSVPSTKNGELIEASKTIIIDETANWKTYTNLTEKISFKYPQDWTFSKQKNIVSVTKSDSLGKGQFVVFLEIGNIYGEGAGSSSHDFEKVDSFYLQEKNAYILKNYGTYDLSSCDAPNKCLFKTKSGLGKIDFYGLHQTVGDQAVQPFPDDPIVETLHAIIKTISY